MISPSWGPKGNESIFGMYSLRRYALLRRRARRSPVSARERSNRFPRMASLIAPNGTRGSVPSSVLCMVMGSYSFTTYRRCPPRRGFSGALPSFMSSSSASRFPMLFKARFFRKVFEGVRLKYRMLRTRGRTPEPWTRLVNRRMRPIEFSF